MVIEQLIIENFKKFNNIKLVFEPGLNIVRGPNEAGKTTIRTALMAVLFGNPVTAGETLKKYRRWNASGMYKLGMIYKDELGRCCEVMKDFEERKSTMQVDDEYYKVPKAIQGKLLEDIGLTSEEMYKLTCSWDIRSLDDLGNESKRKQLGKKIANMMTGSESGQDILVAIKKVEESIKELNKGLKSAAKKPGPIKNTQAEYEKLLVRRQEIMQALSSKKKWVDEKQQLSRQYDDVKKELDALTTLIELNNRKQSLIQRKESLIDQEHAYAEKNQVRESLEEEAGRINEQLNKNTLTNISTSQMELLKEKRKRREELERLLDEMPEETRDGNEKILIILSVAILAAGAGLVFFQWLAGLVVALLGGAVLFMIQRKKSAGQLEYNKMCETKENYLGEKASLDDFIGNWEKQLGQSLSDQLEDDWKTLQTIKIKYDTLQDQLRKMEPVDFDKWREIQRALRLTEEALNDDTMIAAGLAPDDFVKHLKRKELLGKQYDDYRNRITHFNALLGNDKVNQEELAEAEEALEEKKKRLDYLKEREAVLNIAGIYMEKARQDTMNPAKEILESRTSELLSSFTNDKYRHITIDAEDMSSKILIGDTDKWEEPGAMSQGTFDQFYLSLRLALSEILTGGKKVPLLLDEPLSAFDKIRFEKSMESIKKIAGKRQVIIFSCRDEYDYIADHIVELS